jgi:hypothetical protein
LEGVTVNLYDPCGLIATTQTDPSGFYAFSGLCAGDYTVEVITPVGMFPAPSEQGGDPSVDSNGSPAAVNLPANDTEDLTIDFGFCVPVREEFCGFTQGFWGNEGGKFDGVGTLDIIKSLVDPCNPLVIGNSFGNWFSITKAQCIIDRLPAGGPASALPAGLNSAMDDSTCQTTPALPVDRKGKFRNVLLGQVIALSLNVRLSSGPGPFVLLDEFCTEGDGDGVEHFGIPSSVLDALDNLALPGTVDGLLTLANRALAGLPTGGASLSDINDAVDTINNAFDECRTEVDCPEICDDGLDNDGDGLIDCDDPDCICIIAVD